MIKDKTALFANWKAGNNNVTARSPEHFQPKDETWAFKFSAADLIGTGETESGMVQLYETGSPTISVSLSTTPCAFSDSPAALQCQRSGNSGSTGLKYVVNGFTAASDAALASAGYCRAPAIAGTDVYVNVKFAAPPNLANPSASTCTLAACRYFVLYQ